jgi:type IV secretory pathway TrbD component
MLLAHVLRKWIPVRFGVGMHAASNRAASAGNRTASLLVSVLQEFGLWVYRFFLIAT